MAVIGDAYVVVHAITKGFDDEIKRAVSGINLGRDGRNIGRSLTDGINREIGRDLGKSFTKLRREAIQARKAFQSMIRTSYTLGTAASILVSSLGSVVGGIVSLGSSLVAAAPSAFVLVNAFTSLGIAAIGLKGALAGVGAAISAGNKANKKAADNSKQIAAATRALLLATERLTEAQARFNDVIREAQEEVQQLGFDAEDAALSEKRAAIELEKAREGLARVQDLPPNSRARREAQLAFEEAELGLRRAKDKNADLRGEQERLAEAAKKNGTEEYQQTQTYIDALKQLRDLARDQVDAQRELDDAKKGGAGDKAYQDALKDLSKEAQHFVKYMVNTFIPSLKELRNALGERLFGQLEEGLEKLRIKLFPALIPVLKNLGDSIGKSFGTIIDAITDIENIGDLQTVINNAGANVESYARSFSNLYDSFLSLLVGSQKITERFNAWLEKKTGGWKKYLDTAEMNGDLQRFFDKAADIAASLGEIFGNTFSTLGNIVKANFTPGGGGYFLLDWLEKATRRWERFTGSVEGQQKLFDYFKGVAINFKAISQAIGAYLKVFMKLGADPNVGQFWDIIKTGAPYLEQIMVAANGAGPALAKLIVSLMKFVAVTMSTGAMQTFFNTLRIGLDLIIKLIDNPAFQKLLAITATIAAFVSALGLFGTAFAFLGKVMLGVLLKMVSIFTFFMGLPAKLAKIPTVISGIASAFGMATGPFLLIVAAVVAVIAVFVLLYNNSEKLRIAIDKFYGGLKDAFLTGLGNIKTALSEFGPMFSDLGNIFRAVGDFIGQYIVPLFQIVLTGAVTVFMNTIALAIRIVRGLFEIFTGNPLEGFKTIFKAFGTFIVDNFKGMLQNIKKAIAGVPLFESLASGAKTVFNAIAGFWNKTLGKIKFKTPSWIPLIGNKGFEFPQIPLLAEGGVVPAKPGGTLSLIGEAGRPERVEPLDNQGFSKRDRAILDMVANTSKMGAMTVNVYPSPGMKEEELAALVSRQIAFQLRRGGA